jgi:hypothetical protein
LSCAKLTIQEQVGYGGDFVYDKAVGDEIKWKEGKNLTVQTEIKKQRNKSEPDPPTSRTNKLTCSNRQDPNHQEGSPR